MKETVFSDHGGVRVAGYLHHPQRGFLHSKALAEYFGACTDELDFVRCLKEANGCFAVVIQRPDLQLAAVDKLRSIPLFYNAAGELSNDSESLAPLTLEAVKSSPQKLLAEFLITGYVTGSDTLHPQLKQIPAGHYLRLIPGQAAELKKYYRYEHQSHARVSIPELIEHQHALHLAIIKDTISSLDGRLVVIPLSGGYDSRLLAALFGELKYDRIITFSYDSPRNPESLISQKVAKHLQLPWIFFEHSHKSWYDAFNSDLRRSYYKHAVNASSSTHVQDWAAVREMRDRKLIPSDSVFIPGHSADFLQGSHLSAAFGRSGDFSRDELIAKILAKHYRLWPNPEPSDTETFCTRIQSIIDAPEDMSAERAADLFEYWDLQERQAKFILNSLRVYEFFGYDWRIPLWDKRLMDYWAAVPLSLRLGRKLWLHYADKHLRIPVPVFKNPPISQRVIDKILRIAYGELRNVRYGRFAPYDNFRQYAGETVTRYIREDLSYPSFVKKNQALIRCDMNALQALIAIWELKK
ncbi:MAG TPA: asparagine synthetase B family protein [Candidatus Cloacimonadota bacterium]|nr:asparagine synthetase B family protein [Candidatus Cloacimonadota bacterium]